MRGGGMCDDDELSHRSGSLSRNSSGGRSFTGGFSVDWDEIDSIAEESLSVASSVSSGHRKRSTSSRRRNNHQTSSSGGHNNSNGNSGTSGGISALEALESGSLSRYTTNGGSRSSGSGNAGTRSKSSKSNPSSSTQQSKQRQAKQRLATKRWMQDAKRLAVIGGLVMFAIISIHFFGVYLQEFVSYRPSFAGIGADRSARRALSRSTATYATRKWPLSVRDEDFEFLSHPANHKVTLSVPRFFLQKEDGTMETLGRLSKITRPMANMVGRTTVDGSRDFSVRTIFVGIPSFRDWHCRYTVESIFGRAKYPERIRVGVVDQLEQKKGGEDQSCDMPIASCSQKPQQALCLYRDQIDVYEMEAKLAVGPPFARHVVNRLYRGEYYALQVNAHTTFTKNWDVELIEQLEETGNEMAVITTYLDDALGSIDDTTGISQKESRRVLCNLAYEGAGHDRKLRHDYDQQPDMLPGVTGMPQLQPFWAADFAFSRGHFILAVPYDPSVPMIQKADEEISMALRAFSKGYDFYTPEKSVCFDSAYNEKDSLKSFLEHKSLYKGVDKVSMKRLYGLVGMVDDWRNDPSDLYGLGTSRPLSKFHNSFGVHPNEHITERKLCNFVSTGRMHRQFHEHLREDGMGLNYDQIHFRFHELQNNHDA